MHTKLLTNYFYEWGCLIKKFLYLIFILHTSKFIFLNHKEFTYYQEIKYVICLFLDSIIGLFNKMAL